jgi:hypothetical protein
MTTTPISPTLTRIATVRFSDDEYARLQVAAEDRGIPVSALIRRATLKRDIPAPLSPRMDMEAITQLRRIGVNLNQCVRLMSAWRRVTSNDKKDYWSEWRLRTLELRGLLDTLIARLQ